MSSRTDAEFYLQLLLISFQGVLHIWGGKGRFLYFSYPALFQLSMNSASQRLKQTVLWSNTRQKPDDPERELLKQVLHYSTGYAYWLISIYVFTPCTDVSHQCVNVYHCSAAVYIWTKYWHQHFFTDVAIICNWIHGSFSNFTQCYTMRNLPRGDVE